MTDDEVVQAVVEALLDFDATPVPPGATLEQEADALARAALAAARPLIREQAAQEVRVCANEKRAAYERTLTTYGSAVEPGSRDEYTEGYIDGLIRAIGFVREAKP